MDWVALLEDNQIEYVTRGPNTKRGELSVKCPWCGEDDPSQHLGISLSSANWGCLRNRSHSGHNAGPLIAALLGCGRGQAKLIASQYSASDPTDLGEALALLEPTSEAASPAVGLAEEPPAMRPILGGDKRFVNYLGNRGFNSIRTLINNYKLTCCTTGQFKDRIIIPVYRGDELIAWTGRALIDPMYAPRYLSSKNIKTCVFNEAGLHEYNKPLYHKGKVLFLCEGPFDAMKVDYYGREFGARATCTFGTNVTIPQIMILNSLIKNFERARVLFDADAQPQAMQLAEWLPGVTTTLFVAANDPGDLSAEEVRYLATNY